MKSAATGFPVSLVLLPGFPLLALGAVRNLFAVANEQAGMRAYVLRQFAEAGGAVISQCGLALAAEPLSQLAPADSGLILLLADDAVDEAAEVRVGHEIGRVVAAASAEGELVLGAAGAAARILARCGLLDGYRAAIHWQLLADVMERFPRTVFSRGLFEIDRDRISAGAGFAVLDLLAEWLALRHGRGFAAEIAAALGLERLRAGDERQPMPASAQPAVGSARIREALELMEANLGEPLPAEEIARLVGVSRRQLERLFRQHLDTLPARYYLELRLKHARRQLRQTTRSILQVGLACGFASGPHFSTAYRIHFGHTPREERAQRKMPQPSRPTGDDTP